MKCDNCDSVATYIEEEDPYTKEICGEIELVNLCDVCYDNSCGDI